MNIRGFLILLQTSVIAILATLGLMAYFTLNPVRRVGAAAGAGEVSVQAAAPTPAYQLGKTTWNANGCGACHNKNMQDNATGPALAGVTARWAGYPREDLYAWIRGSQMLVSQKHPRAITVAEAYPGVMPNFPDLTQVEIEGLLVYIEGE